MMGQFNAVPSNSRVMFDVDDNNGLVLCDKYMPVEVLTEIFCHTDCKTLLRCQLVCKRWKMLLMDNVWHKKTERTLGKPFPWDDKMPWSVYYLACAKRPYERNLVKNHSGAEGMDHWKLIYNGGDCWTVEEPPVGIPKLPQTEPLFKYRQICFAKCYKRCSKIQIIVLMDEGIHPYILDTYQPPIVVSEWYGCRLDCPAEYQLQVKLFDTDYKLIDTFQFSDILEEEKKNQWLKVSHVFEKYGRGLRRIIFEHNAEDGSFYTLCGSKMAGACVYVKIP